MELTFLLIAQFWYIGPVWFRVSGGSDKDLKIDDINKIKNKERKRKIEDYHNSEIDRERERERERDKTCDIYRNIWFCVYKAMN